MDRRKFIRNTCNFCIATSGVTTLTAFLESCGTINTFLGKKENNSISVPITELENKNSLIIKQKGSEPDIALIKSKSGEWKALLMICTHASNPLTFVGNRFRCNKHFSEFNLNGIPQNGPAQKPLKILETILSKNNILIKLSAESR